MRVGVRGSRPRSRRPTGRRRLAASSPYVLQDGRRAGLVEHLRRPRHFGAVVLELGVGSDAVVLHEGEQRVADEGQRQARPPGHLAKVLPPLAQQLPTYFLRFQRRVQRKGSGGHVQRR